MAPRGPKGPHPKRNPAQIEQDRILISELLLKRWKIVNIAQQLHLTPQRISQEVKVIERRWRESTIMNFNEARARELQRIDMMEAEAWAAWEASKGERRSSRTRQRTLPPGISALPSARPVDPEDMASLLRSGPQLTERTEKEAMVRIDQRDPDPRFLQIVEWCIEQRIRLLGLAPDAVRAPDGVAEEPIRRVVVYMERGGGGDAPDGASLPPGPPADLANGNGRVIDVPPRDPAG